jgi:hypothetical protein
MNIGRYRKTAVLAMKKVFLLTEPDLQVHEWRLFVYCI